MTQTPTTKCCTKCGAEYPATLEFFPPDKQMRMGLHSWCRVCFRARNKEYEKRADPEKRRQRARKYYHKSRQKNKEKLAEKSREYYEKNKEKIKERKREWYWKNRDWLLEREKERRGSKKIDDDDDYSDLVPIGEYDTFRSWAVITSAEYAAYNKKKNRDRIPGRNGEFEMNLNSPDPTENHIFWILVITCLLAVRSAYPEPATPPKPPADIAQILRTAERQHDLPIGLAVCIAWHESEYKPTALSRNVGGYRSRGLMQIYHKYQNEIVRKYTDIPVNLFDWKNPRHSAQAGCGYLAHLIDRFDGDLYAAVLAYNWGEGNVSALLAGSLTENDIPAHCTNYVKNVLRMLDNVVGLW